MAAKLAPSFPGMSSSSSGSLGWDSFLPNHGIFKHCGKHVKLPSDEPFHGKNILAEYDGDLFLWDEENKRIFVANLRNLKAKNERSSKLQKKLREYDQSGHCPPLIQSVVRVLYHVIFSNCHERDESFDVRADVTWDWTRDTFVPYWYVEVGGMFVPYMEVSFPLASSDGKIRDPILLYCIYDYHRVRDVIIRKRCDSLKACGRSKH